MHRTLMAVLLPVLVACAGDKTTTDSGEDTDTGEAPVTYPPTWAGVEQLFAENCDRCHPSQQQIDLHTLIPDDIAGDQYYVVPGSSADSFLWQMVTGGSIFTMPPITDVGLLPIETVEAIRGWIDDGAILE